MNLRALLVAAAATFGAMTAPAVHAAAINVTEAPGLGAGSLLSTAQITSPGDAPLASISGALDPVDDVDVYAIKILGGLFTATTSGSFASDLGLWLFDSSGRGVKWNSGGTSDGPFPQALLSLANVTEGVYFLAVARALNLPLDADGNAIFDVGLDGPLTLNPLDSWEYLGSGGNDDRDNAYTITFGVGAFGVPEPATGALLGLGLLGAAFARRRRTQ